MRNMFLATVGLLLCIQGITASDGVRLKYSKVVSYLREKSDPDVIPITEDGPLNINISLQLTNIFEVDQEHNEIEVGVYLVLSWKNPALAWDTTDEGFDSDSISLPDSYLWTPDINLGNAVHVPEVLSPRFALVSKTGVVTSVPFLRVRVACDLKDLETTEGANCTLKFFSWTLDARYLSFTLPENSFLIDEYVPNPKYHILSTSSNKNFLWYSFGPFEDVKFFFVIRSRSPTFPVF